jgi:hypothetical protein
MTLPPTQPATALTFPGWENFEAAFSAAATDAGVKNVRDFNEFRFLTAEESVVDGGDLRGLARVDLALNYDRTLDYGRTLVFFASAVGPFDAGQTTISLQVDTGLVAYPSERPGSIVGSFQYSIGGPPPPRVQGSVIVAGTALLY